MTVAELVLSLALDDRVEKGEIKPGVFKTHHVVTCDHKMMFVDFAAPELKLAFEVDGKAFCSTASQREHNMERDEALKRNGWIVLRFPDEAVIADPCKVAGEIVDAVSKRAKQ